MAKTTGNAKLHQAQNNGKDEYYTQLPDIEKELKHYRNFFKNKTVFCNCDDPYESNFFKYFALNFNALGLKKLIATCYSASPVMGGELPLFDRMNGKKAYKIEITEVTDANYIKNTLLKNIRNMTITMRSTSIMWRIFPPITTA